MNLLSIISGILLTISFAPFSYYYVSFIALVPLLFSIQETDSKHAFKKGYIAGLSHYLTLLYWIPYPISKYGGIPIYLSIPPYILLCMYISLFTGIFCWLCRIKEQFSLITYPFYWILLEFIRANFFTGFPWCLLGYSQYKNIHIIQVADIIGIYGISFLIVLINVFIYKLLKKDITAKQFVFVGFICLGTYCYGVYRLNEPLPIYKKIKVAIIQGDIDQSLKWNPTYQKRTMDIYTNLTRKSYLYKPTLIVWPETAVPFFFQDKGKFAKKIFYIVKESKATLIFGSPAYIKNQKGIKYYNRAYMISYGHSPIYYDKVHLVPFGEYVPLKRVLFFLNRLVPAAGDFSSGHKIYPLKSNGIVAGIMICFEAIFPEIARHLTLKGANILVNISNDAWFGKTFAPYQHLSMSVLRAVENRRSLVRSTNTGISVFVDPFGRIIKKSALFKRQILLSTLPLIKDYKSLYTIYGNVIVYIAIIITFFNTGGILWQKLKEQL